MGQLLMLKTLGDKNIISKVKKVEAYQERKGCTIIAEAHDNGMYVYDGTNVLFLLNIVL